MKKYLVTFISKRTKEQFCEVEVTFEEEPNFKSMICVKAIQTLKEIGIDVKESKKFDWQYKEVK